MKNLIQVMCPHDFKKISDDKARCRICKKEVTIIYEIENKEGKNCGIETK